MIDLATFAVVPLVAAHGVQAATAYLTRRRPRRSKSASTTVSSLPISILVPIGRTDRYSERCLSSLFALRHRPIELIFCAVAPDDPAIAIVERLRDAHPEIDATVLIGRATTSHNPKLDNLEKGWATARHTTVLIVDDNVEVLPDLVDDLLARLDATTGVVCAVPAGVEPGSFWAEVECAFMNTHQARMLFAAETLPQGSWAHGKAMLLSSDLVEAPEAFAGLGAEAAEDLAATFMARRAGLAVRFAGDTVAQPLGARGFATVWSRQLRWAQLRCRTVTALFALEPLATSLTPMVAAAILGSGSLALSIAFPLGSLALWTTTEMVLARAEGWPAGPRMPLAILARDVTTLAIWSIAWFRRRYRWRDDAVEMMGGRRR